MYTEAFPVLREFGFKATVFLVTGYCGNHNDWPGNLPSLERSSLLSWDEIREMSAHGIEFGSHTANHPDLTRIPLKQAEQEIAHSRQQIEDRLGSPVTLFAYPYGRWNSQVKDIVRSHFQGACSTKLGSVRAGGDPYMIRRIDSYFVANPMLFGRLTATSLACYLQFRQALRELKSF